MRLSLSKRDRGSVSGEVPWKFYNGQWINGIEHELVAIFKFTLSAAL